MMLEKKLSYGAIKSLVYCVQMETNQPYIIHNYDNNPGFPEVSECFIVPFSKEEENCSFQIKANFPFQIQLNDAETEVTLLFDQREAHPLIKSFEGVPDCDVFGNTMELDFANGSILKKTMYYFYWGTMLPSVIEKTRAKEYPVSSGYVVSTLQKGAYAGTYPDVDHEFQIKGRMAMASQLDLAIVKRMIELQIKLMKEDPEQAYRDPCAIQPDGTREYHVRRSSMDGHENAEMFLVTGNIEIIESAMLFYAATKDFKWLEQQIEGLENALSLVESCIDKQGRLWSDVYYEDQVIKDGRECMAAALAANAFGDIAKLEKLLNRTTQEKYYLKIAKKLKDALVKELPGGFWDTKEKRFIDWVDRSSKQHDHIHLLANELPVLFQYATKEQEDGVDILLEKYFDEFQRFPSFVAGKIEDYADAELGTGGPYDLCAAGRYWCWDFAYWMKKERKDILEHQLLALCCQAKLDHFRMGERYDMNHVYYQSDINWHGAAHYYEYPCVFTWNLIEGYLGIKHSLEADLEVRPMIHGDGRVKLENPQYGIEYVVKQTELSITNLLNVERTFIVKWNKEIKIITLPGNETFHW